MLLQDYDGKATSVRENFKRTKAMTEANTDYTTDYKFKTVKAAREKMAQDLQTLWATYKQDVEKQRHDMAKKTFRPSGSQAEFLATMANADALDSKGRTALAQNAILIDAHDAVKAVAFSAYNNGDHTTLRCISENASSDISESLNGLMTASREENPFSEMSTFSTMGL